MTINFECKKCGKVFDCDVGEISVSPNDIRPTFTKTIKCPTCGESGMDDVFLTEVGQSQMTEATLKNDEIDDDELSDVAGGGRLIRRNIVE